MKLLGKITIAANMVGRGTDVKLDAEPSCAMPSKSPDSFYCFVAGTLVWTEHGNVPIEQIKVGDRVLSQPEDGGSRAHRPVLRTIRHGKKTIVAVRYVDKRDGNTRVTYATDNHRFWCAGRGWVAAVDMRPGFELQTADSSALQVKQVAPVYATNVPGRGWHAAGVGHDPQGILVEFEGGFRSVAKSNPRMSDVIDDPNDRLEVDVYDFEVDEFHSYYVGSSGVWVHDANCKITRCTSERNPSFLTRAE